MVRNSSKLRGRAGENADVENLWGHYGVTTISGGGQRGDPGVGVLAIQAAEALLLTVGALGDEPVKRRSIHLLGGRTRDFSPRLGSARTHGRFWS